MVSACAAANSRSHNAQDDCIEITHVGEQDKPLPGLRICVGEKGKATLDRDYRWTFWFEASIVRALETYVVSKKPKSASAGGDQQPGEYGTFAVSWGQKPNGNRYLLFPKAACSYFAEVRRICAKGENPDCTQALGDLMRRLSCI